MALGGGVFTNTNKELPGAYINVISTATATQTLSDRGIAAIGMELNWGAENSIMKIEQEDFRRKCIYALGYNYDDDEMKVLREVFCHSQTVYVYNLRTGGTKATCTYADAKHQGKRGNSIKIVIEDNENSTETNRLYDVHTYMGTVKVDSQYGVSAMSGLENNDFVTWKTSATIATTAGTDLSGGTNGSSSTATHQAFLDCAEAYAFNALACNSTESTIVGLYVAYTRRMRDERGKKFQTVVYNTASDYEGIVSVKNSSNLIPWVTGVIAGTAINASATSMEYDGEYDVPIEYTQADLERLIRCGYFAFHLVDGAVVVLEDINSLTTFTDVKSSDFKMNQTIRVVDQIANDISALFAKKYNGKIPNDKSGRASLWSDIVDHHTALENARAIEDFDSDNVVVSPVEGRKNAVSISDAVKTTCSMEQLYMTLYVER